MKLVTPTAYLANRLLALLKHPRLHGKIGHEQVRTASLCIVTALVGVFYWHYTKHFRPVQEKIASLTIDAKDLKDQYQEKLLEEANLENAANELRQRLNTINEKRAAMLNREGTLARDMIAPGDTKTLEEQLIAAAEGAGLQVRAMEKARNVVKATSGLKMPFVRMDFTMEATGSFPNATAFLTRIESAPWPLTVTLAEIREPRRGDTQAQIGATFTVILPEPEFEATPPALAKLPKNAAGVAVRDLLPSLVVKQVVEEKPKAVVWGELKLTGIMGAGESRVAIINNQVLRRGGTVNDAAIAEIHDDRVVLEKNGQRKEIRFRQ